MLTCDADFQVTRMTMNAAVRRFEIESLVRQQRQVEAVSIKSDRGRTGKRRVPEHVSLI